MNRAFWKQLWYLLIVAFVGLALVAVLSLVLFTANLHAIQWLQTIFLMFLPPLLWCRYIRKKEPFATFGFVRPGWKALALTAIIVIISIPFMDLVTVLNARVPLPDSLELYLKELQLAEQQTLEMLLDVDGIGGWIELILLMSIGTAIGEETMFRGGLLEVFRISTLNKHVVAIVIGFIFSFIHFDIYGFVPRWMLGTFFCYLVYWTGSIWPGILAHALNNLIALLQYKLIEIPSLDQQASFTFSWPIMALSTVATVLLIWSLKRTVTEKETLPNIN